MATTAYFNQMGNNLTSNLIAGGVMGLLTVTSAVSFGSVIFAGDLAPALPFGIGLLLFSSVVISIVITSFSSYKGMIATIAESMVPIFALLVRQVSAAMPGVALEQKLLTVVATLVFGSILTGVVFFALGWFKLGRLIRFIPFPVVGGFLAAIGALLLIGAVQTLYGVSWSPFKLESLLQANVLMQLIPALIFAGVMFYLPQRITHPLLYPGIILGAIALFYLGLMATGMSVSTAQAQGLLLNPMPAGQLYQFKTIQALQQADWSVVFRQLPTLASLWLIASTALLLHANGIELIISRDLDLSHELKVAGVASIASGLGGGVGGFPSSGENALSYQLNGTSRLVGWMIAAICLAIMIGGAPLLSFFPRFILIGVPIAIALEFINEWLYQAWFKFSRSDYAIIVLILLVTVTVGYLQAIGIGLLAAIGLFVIDYSQLAVTRRVTSGEYIHSNVLRTSNEIALLEREGNQIFILELQGVIFFGTANKLLEQIRDRLDNLALPPVHFIILDFRSVNGLDAAAILSFSKIKQLAHQQQVHLLFTHLSPSAHRRLQQGDCLESDDPYCHVFEDLDRGLEWCEQQILQTSQVDFGQDKRHRSPDVVLTECLKADFSDPNQVDRLMPYLKMQNLEVGEYLFRQGDPFDGLYFVGAGQVSVVLELEGEQTKRIRTYTVGNTIGEMGLYRQTSRMASVVADQPSTVYFLPAETFEAIEAIDPVLASNIHRFIVNLLAERLQHREQELKHLLESPAE